MAAVALLVKSWWASESAGRDSAQIRERVADLGKRQGQLEDRLDSVGQEARRAIDSVKEWMAREVERKPESTAVEAVVPEETAETRAQKVWREALGALPKDLNAYERLVAEQELKETLAKRFDLTREQMKKVTAGS